MSVSRKTAEVEFGLTDTAVHIPTSRRVAREISFEPPSYHLSEFDEIFKRTFDIFFCLVALTVFAIPMAVIALAIKLESRGPIFYRQERVGLNGKTFKMWKFRSMRVDAEKNSSVGWTVE